MWVTLLSGVVGALVAPVAVRRGKLAWLLAAIPLVSVIALLTRTGAGASPEVWRLPWLPALGLSLDLRLDGLSLLFCLVVGVVAVAVLLYAPAYLAEHPRRGRLCALLLLFQSAMVGLVLADDIVLLFCFWEATSVLSYLLVGFDCEDEKARKAALRALLVTGLGGLALLAGLILLGEAAGTTRLSELAGRATRVRADPQLGWIVGLVLLGAFTKSAQLPFHFWLPGAMTAPSPASAFLHAATMVKAGVYLLLRLSPVLGGVEAWDTGLVLAGSATMLYGGLVAPTQDSLKGLLAHTTLSALGTLVLLIGLGTASALQAALVFLVAHALYKGAMFLVAGSVTHGTGQKGMDRLGGLRTSMPRTALAAGLGLAAMAGLPPTLGFVGKESLLRVASGSSAAPVLVTALSVSAAAAIVAAAWIFWKRVFVGVPRDTTIHAHEGRWEIWVAPLGLGLLALTWGPAVGWLDAGLLAPALQAVLPAATLEPLALWHGFDPALGLEALAIASGLLLALRSGALARIGQRVEPWIAAPARVYEGALALLLASGRRAAAIWGLHLRTAVLTVVAGTVVLVGAELSPVTWPSSRGFDPGPHVVDLLVVALAVAGALVATTTRTRLATVLSLGATGYAVAVLFTAYGAPDLAMTQFVVETLAVVLFVIAFRGLPAMRPAPPRSKLLVDTAVATVFGLVMARCVFLALDVQVAPAGSAYYAARAGDAHGRNVVNLILSDFRALDTLGEITVLAIAGIGVAALIRSGRRAT